MSPRPRTTLIIPAYNEAERLQTGFERLMRASDEGRIDLDDLSLLYVDDGSTDDTASVARSIVETVPTGSVLVQAHNQGKGAAIRAGVAVARTDLLAFTDADMAIDPRQLPSLLGALGAAPVAVGNRAVAGKIDYGSSLRTRAGRTFNLLVRMLSDVELPDTQCGWKGARTAEAKLLFHLTTIDGFAFDVEFLARASMLGWTIAEVPVSWSDVGGSHVRLLRDSSQMLGDLITARLRPRLPAPLHGLTVPRSTSCADLCAACAGSPLEAAPIVEQADGRCTLAAALLDPTEALGALGMVAKRLGGTPVTRAIDELRSATSITAALAP